MKKRLFATVTVFLTSTTALLVLLVQLGGASPNVSRPTLAAAALQAPTVTSIDPTSAPNDLDTPIVISGTGFLPELTGTLAMPPAMAYLGAAELEEVTWVSGTTLTATVPWGQDPGVYTLTVVNPDGGTASLTNAFTVTQGFGVWNARELYGGSIEHVVINPVTPTTLYAISSDVGLFRSRDGAETWAFQNASTVDYLAIDPISPTRIYIVAYPHAGGYLNRSDDEGDTWIPLTTTFPTTPPPADDCWGGLGVYAHPSTPGTVYAHECDTGVEDGKSGLIKSTNWGQDWEPAIDGLTDTQVTVLAFHPDDPDTMYLGTAGGKVYRSFDGGGWWQFASSPLGYVATLAINPFGDDEVWVSSLNAFGDPCALLKSANADLTTWTAMEPLGQPVCATSIDFAPTVSGTVFIAGMKDYKTADGGATWEPFGPPDVSIQDITLHPTDPGIIYVGDTKFGVHRTTDGGATWEIANQGLTAVVPHQIETVPGQPDIVYTLASGDIYKGTRGGGVWQRLPISRTGSFLVDPGSPAHVYAGAHGDIYASTDGGDTWPTRGELVPPPQYADCNHFPLALLTVPGQPGTVLAGVQHSCGLAMVCPGSIYRSTDYGVHWDHVYPSATQEISKVNDLAYDPLSPTVIYAATGEAGYGGGLLKSIDGGLNWEPVGAGVIDWALGVAVEPGTHRVFVSSFSLPLYVSNDGGTTWTPTGYGGGHNVYDILFAPGDPPVLYDAAYQGLYRSTDGAQSWQPAAGELGRVPVYSLAVVTATDRVILYAGTTGGVVTDTASARTQAETSATLVNAGVYRYTTRVIRMYLPLIFKSFAP